MTARFDGAQIAAATRGTLLRDALAGALGTDTRANLEGRWFVALRGANFDGNDHVLAAQKAGAIGCIVERRPPPEWNGGAILVENGGEALTALASTARDRFERPIVGLTGSSGKTTTRALTALALRPLGLAHQTAGNLNNQIGVPMTLLDAPLDAGVWVVEMGTSEPGEIAALASLVRPHVRLIVNVGPSHLEGLRDLSGVAAEKGALFATARPGDTCCVRADDPYVLAMPICRGVRTVTWGREGDIALVDVSVDGAQRATMATYDTPQGRKHVRLSALGEHIAVDAAGALAVAFSLGVDLEDAAQAMQDYAPVGMRMRIVDLPNGATLINDAYNANPASTIAAARTLATMPGRRTLILGDMLELGEDAERWHRDVAAVVAGLGFDRVVLIGEEFASDGVAQALPGASLFSDVGDAIARLGWRAQADDVLLLKASRGMRLDRLADHLTTDSER